MDQQEVNRLGKIRDGIDVLLENLTLRDGYIHGAAYYSLLALRGDVEKKLVDLLSTPS